MWPANGTRRARWARAVACLFVVAILSDLALDSTCDWPETGAPASSSLAPPGHAPDTRDPCADGCLPDCFCCSQSVTRAPAILSRPAEAVAVAACPPPAPDPAGVRPVPYHPPRSIA